MAASRFGGKRQRYGEELVKIDAQDGQNGAELNENREGVTRRFEAEKMAGQQDMRGRGHRYEFRQAFEKAEQKC
ncbi:hypothetical protein D3C87_1905780 [compost metagenome]